MHGRRELPKVSTRDLLVLINDIYLTFIQSRTLVCLLRFSMMRCNSLGGGGLCTRFVKTKT